MLERFPINAKGRLMEKIKLTESERHPLCPYCEAQLSEMHWHKVSGGSMSLGYTAIFSCSRCRKVLGSTGQSH